MVEDTKDPTETMHFEYRYIKSKAGPLYKAKNENHIIFKSKPIIKEASYERKGNGGVRMCQRCLRTKPDRTHHCS